MATKVPVARVVSGELFRYDRAHLQFQILGEDVDLTEIPIRVVFLERRGSSVIRLEKTEGDVTKPVADVVDVLIGGSTEEQLLADWQNLPPGVYFLEMYQLGTPLKIAEAYVTIGHGLPPSGV